jgi:hypothetical protein
MSRSRRSVLYECGVLLALLLCAGWETVAQDDGLTIEVQPVEGSAFENLRVTGTTSASPEAYAAAWWGKASDSSASPEVAKREIFVDEPNERLYWDLVRSAPASDRDYVMHLKRNGNEITFESVDDKRKPAGDYVRMRLKGSLKVTPDPKGARITYVVFTDIGGLVPPLFARGAQRQASINLVKEIRRRAEAARK